MVERTSTRPGRNEDDGREDAELREELTRSQEEILRLRDLLIAKDAELGMAKGRLAEITEHSSRLFGLVRAVRARIPRFISRAGASFRRRG